MLTIWLTLGLIGAIVVILTAIIGKKFNELNIFENKSLLKKIILLLVIICLGPVTLGTIIILLFFALMFWIFSD